MPEGGQGSAPEDEFFQIPHHAGLPVAEAVAMIQRHFRPEAYLQIGGSGELALHHVDCPSIVVHENPPISPEMLGSKSACLFMQMCSGEFFSSYDPSLLLNRRLDLALLSGAPLFEIVLRDFINTERHCKRDSVILLTDCLPTDAHVARRNRADWRFAHRSPRPRAWAGDLWKIPAILQLYRSDLRMLVFDATPDGLIAVTDLDPCSDVLRKEYFAITGSIPFGPPDAGRRRRLCTCTERHRDVFAQGTRRIQPHVPPTLGRSTKANRGEPSTRGSAGAQASRGSPDYLPIAGATGRAGARG